MKRSAPALLLALTGCAGIDEDQARLCRIALPALEASDARITVSRIRAAQRGVRVEYTADGRERFARCRFALGRRMDLEAITTDRGEVPGATVYLLRRYYVDTPDGVAGDPGAP